MSNKLNYDWDALYDEYKTTGLSIFAFAKKKHISIGTAYRYLKPYVEKYSVQEFISLTIRDEEYEDAKVVDVSVENGSADLTLTVNQYSITHKSRKGESAMNVKPVACMVHIRRKFVDALKFLKTGDREGFGPQIAIDMIARIFHIDNQFNNLSPNERRIKRNEIFKLAMEAFF